MTSYICLFICMKYVLNVPFFHIKYFKYDNVLRIPFTKQREKFFLLSKKLKIGKSIGFYHVYIPELYVTLYSLTFSLSSIYGIIREVQLVFFIEKL